MPTAPTHVTLTLNPIHTQFEPLVGTALAQDCMICTLFRAYTWAHKIIVRALAVSFHSPDDAGTDYVLGGERAPMVQATILRPILHEPRTEFEATLHLGQMGIRSDRVELPAS